MASKVLNKMRRNDKGMMFKIDFEKVYGYVGWEFLWFILRKMGFGERWIRWRKKCVTSIRVSVLVTGSTRKEFNMKRCLKQGCPLSPLLFNLVVELLPILAYQFENQG